MCGYVKNQEGFVDIVSVSYEDGCVRVGIGPASAGGFRLSISGSLCFLSVYTYTRSAPQWWCRVSGGLQSCN